jgi:hypothetical protein
MALCTWAQPTTGLGLLGQAAQLPWAFRPVTEETGEGLPWRGEAAAPADSGEPEAWVGGGVSRGERRRLGGPILGDGERGKLSMSGSLR